MGTREEEAEEDGQNRQGQNCPEPGHILLRRFAHNHLA
jgi:hypothetical protein